MRRWLWPREHGAYPQLLFPVVTGFAMGGASAAGAAFAAAFVSAFLAHEPLLVQLGVRGDRQRVEHAAVARRQLVVLGALAAALFALGGALAPAVLPLAAVPAALGLGFSALVVRRWERSLAGEVWVGIALASTVLPIAAAGGRDLGTTLWGFVTWSVAFALSIVSVRAALEAGGRIEGISRDLGPMLAIVVLFAALIALFAYSSPALVAVVPTAVVSLAISLRPPALRRLKRLGWSLVAGQIATFVLLVATLPRLLAAT